MNSFAKRMVPIAALAIAAGPMVMASSASATEGGTTNLVANLTQLNDSGASATARATLSGNRLHITIKSQGMLACAPHAQHIHIGGQNMCPATDAKGKGPSGHLRTTDAAPQYGAVQVSLTKTGDSSAKSALAVTRFPVGDATYERTITLPGNLAAQIRDGKGIVVRHGVDYNGNGKYDGSAKSDLDPKLPAEATDPAACGALKVSQMNQIPSGGVQTGDGSTAGIQDGAALAGGALLVAAGTGGLVLARRRRMQDAR